MPFSIRSFRRNRHQLEEGIQDVKKSRISVSRELSLDRCQTDGEGVMIIVISFKGHLLQKADLVCFVSKA